MEIQHPAKPAPGTGKYVLAGIVFAILWPSASTATKIGLQSAQPFVLAVARFFIAGLIMLLITHIIMRNRLPVKKEWIQIIIYGLINISIYLGLYIVAMQQVSAGLGSLSIAINPVFITVIAAVWLSQKLHLQNLFSLLLCITGVIVAALPLLQKSFATPGGMSILLLSMIAYSVGTVYYSRVKWNGLHTLTINGWQTIIGGIFLLPLLLFTYRQDKNVFDARFWKAVSWLSVPVSIVAVQLWLFLIEQNPVKASYWLFLCPVIGFVFAYFIMNEPVGLYTLLGVILVLGGLYIAQKIK